MRKTILSLLMVLFLGVVALVLITASKLPQPGMMVPPPAQPEPAAPMPAQKDDLIVLDSPLPTASITSPLVVTGKARGNWFFEGSFPVTVLDSNRAVVAEGYATAQGEWMTTDYVPFVGTITFTKPDTSVSDGGWIILKKDNPSGEAKFDNSLEVPIRYQ